MTANLADEDPQLSTRTFMNGPDMKSEMNNRRGCGDGGRASGTRCLAAALLTS